jgi:hypothetical protein
MLHAFVFSAVALIVFDGTEYLGAKKAVSLGLEGPVIDGLGLLDLPIRPFPDFLRGCQRKFDCIETRGVFRLCKEAV